MIPWIFSLQESNESNHSPVAIFHAGRIFFYPADGVEVISADDMIAALTENIPHKYATPENG